MARSGKIFFAMFGLQEYARRSREIDKGLLQRRRATCAHFLVMEILLAILFLQLLPRAYASASSATTRTLNGCHGLGRKATPGGNSQTRSRSRGCPEVRTIGNSGQRCLTSHAKSMPSIAPVSRTSAK